MSSVADVGGQRAGLREPVPRAAALLGRAGARLPRAPALPAAAASVSRERRVVESELALHYYSASILYTADFFYWAN